MDEKVAYNLEGRPEAAFCSVCGRMIEVGDKTMISVGLCFDGEEGMKNYVKAVRHMACQPEEE